MTEFLGKITLKVDESCLSVLNYNRHFHRVEFGLNWSENPSESTTSPWLNVELLVQTFEDTAVEVLLT